MVKNSKAYTYSAGGFIVNEQCKVLLVQEYGHYWGLPRGHIETGETPLQAAIREIKEETGIINLKLCSKLGSYTRSTFDKNGAPDYKELKHITFFHFEASRSVPKPHDPAITAAGWFTFEEAREKFINKEDQQFFDKCIETISI